MRCRDCRFWYGDDKNPDFPDPHDCRRYAPRPRMVHLDEMPREAVVWPRTEANDWCGEFMVRGGASR